MQTSARTFTFPGSNLSVNRLGYGAMKLTGPAVWGPPPDEKLAIALLREAVELGVNHIDTSDYYGPHFTNQIIKRALHPYREDLVIVTKVGARRAADKSWPVALSDSDLTSAVHDNLRNLGLDSIPIVNLRVGGMQGPKEASIEAPLRVLMGLREQGLIRHIGLSNVTANQIEEAQKITDIVCVQNHYNLVHRHDDAMIDALAERNIAYTPFFPLGGFSPLQSAKLEQVAKSMEVTPMQIALAWLIHRSPNILLIPGTGSLEHLRENVSSAELTLPPQALEELASQNSLM